MNKEIEDIYTRLALVLFGIIIGWIFQKALDFLPFIVGVFGLLILGVVYIIHSKVTANGGKEKEQK